MPGIAALCVAYLLSQFYRSFLAVLSPVLAIDLSMTPKELAMASGAWFAAFALAQFPIGYGLDTWGPRRTAGILHGVAAGGGAAVFAMATTPTEIIIAMALIGVGCAPVLMAAFFLFARNFSARGFATLGSTFIAVGTLGNIIGSSPLAWAINQYGWHLVAWFLCVFTTLTALAVLFLVRDPERVTGSGPNQNGSYLALMKIPQLWRIFPLILLGYGVAAGVRGLWAGPILRDVYGYDVTAIGTVTFYMAVALSVGSLAYGPMDRLLNSRKIVAMVGNLVVLACAAWLAMGLPVSVTQTSVLFVVIGFFGTSYAVLMAHGKAFVPAEMTGRGVTLMNFFSIGGVGLLQWLGGYVVTHYGVSSDPQAGYQALFIVYAATLAVALVIYGFARDSKPSQA
ncbi:MAG: MFS transporter [Nitratireductor sp.]|nr:MFS transporter [Nitratireductor sp.]